MYQPTWPTPQKGALFAARWPLTAHGIHLNCRELLRFTLGEWMTKAGACWEKNGMGQQPDFSRYGISTSKKLVGKLEHEEQKSGMCLDHL